MVGVPLHPQPQDHDAQLPDMAVDAPLQFPKAGLSKMYSSEAWQVLPDESVTRYFCGNY